jgi:surfactin synthase thioesterase subunit
VFRSWDVLYPDDVEIRAAQLPGRQDRLRDRPFTRVAPIVEALASEVSSLPGAANVLFGHSFGALIAYELARRLQACGTPAAALVVGARRAPHLGLGHPLSHQLSDAAFVRLAHDYYGTTLAILRDPDLMELALPSLRADFEALETYVHRSGVRLDCPLTVLQATQDPAVPRDMAAAWREVVAGDFDLRTIEAGHFFVDTHAKWVLEEVSEVVRRIRREGGTGAVA